MSTLWDLARAYGMSVNDNVSGDARYEDVIEHGGQYDACDPQPLASGGFNDATPKPERDTAQGYIPAGYAHKSNHAYELSVSTPPLSPSTTISSLPTDESHYLSDSIHEDREEVRRGKQPTIPDASTCPEEEVIDEYASAQDEDWYGMQYALEQSRYEYPGSVGVWPPTAGESSTSDAAFVAMYDGHIYPQDVAYWYEHWCKWHRALAREEKRRRDRAASDAKRTRVYNHATYVEWERSQNKKATRGPGCRRVKANDLDPSPLVDLPLLGTAKHQ